MKKMIIENKGLTGYYLDQKLDRYPEESGLKVIIEEDEETEETNEVIELHYVDEVDLANKLGFIFMILMDK